MASDIAVRLRASLQFDAVNGDALERATCASQMDEAAREIYRLRSEIAALRSDSPVSEGIEVEVVDYITWEDPQNDDWYDAAVIVCLDEDRVKPLPRNATLLPRHQVGDPNDGGE